MSYHISTRFVSSLFLSLAAVFWGCDVAPGEASSSPKGVVPAASGQQWEYIVVSYGKTMFGSPDKTLAYRGLGLPEGHEASEFQKSLDILGRFGWEVVSLVGQIGGDQQVVLKRRFERSRTADETVAILKDFADILDRQQRRIEEQAREEAAVGEKTGLIELDAAERGAAIRNRMIKLQETAKMAFATSDLSKFDSITLSKVTDNITSVTIHLDIDLTNQFLKDGRSYRQSEVDEFMKEQLEVARKVSIPMDGQGGVWWQLTGYITFNGERQKVWSGRV